jgi:large subunit ribosomal protein L4
VVRSHAFKLNKKVRLAALKSALSRRAADQAVFVLEDLALPEFKTRQVTDLLERFDMNDALIVAARDEKLERSARNLASVTVLPPEGLNVYDVLRRKNLVLTRAAVDAVTTRLQAEKGA